MQWRHFHRCVFIFRRLHNIVDFNFSFRQNNAFHHYNTRQRSQNKLGKAKNHALLSDSLLSDSSIIHSYYMASSASGQDEPNRALWLATRAGKMEPSCPLGTTRCIPQAKFHQKPYNKSFIDQVCSVKMAEYWPRSFFASLLTLTLSWSINTQKKNLANIQLSWPHTWSVTHTHSKL